MSGSVRRTMIWVIAVIVVLVILLAWLQSQTLVHTGP
jgi:hypothetical protein